ncbi:MAG: peptidoglycan bridge formation glycyltransferase FemA/FemB family protein [Candidatus Omnitrophica bacterium]|nr:peptidoglycan bridge formation glycyltransferase FemA/FemB family protein [Candidatus Omnitrophota bacterium]
MNLKQINKEEGEIEAIDQFVLSSPSGHLFQTYAWGEVSRELGWQPLRFLFENKGKICGFAQILQRKKFHFSIFYIPRGPIFCDSDSLSSIVQAIKTLMIKERGIFCKINPLITKSSSCEELFRKNNFIKSKMRDMHVCTYRINLSMELSKIWGNFRGNVRTAIRKAERVGVVVNAGETLDDLNKFYKVYQTLSEEGKTSTHVFSFFKKIVEEFGPKKQVKIFTADFEGRTVACEFIFFYAKKAEQMWAASLKLNNDIGASQLIHWKIINWLKENDFLVYDLGGVPPDKNELPGIQFYKQGLGGERFELAGEYEIAGNPMLYFFWRKFCSFYINRKKIILRRP